MVRMFSGLLIALLFLAGFTLAEQDSKGAKKEGKKEDYTYEVGLFESYKDETLTLKVDNKEKKFKVPGDTQVGYSTGGKEDKTIILKAKEHLKDVKKGSTVAVTLDGEGKKVQAIGVIVAKLPKGKSKDREEKKD